MAKDDFERIRCIDEGSQAKIWLWVRPRDKMRMVVKSYKEQGCEWKDKKPIEAYILTEVLPPHPRIARCQNWRVDSADKLQLSFDYFEGGHLKKFTRSDGPALPENFLWHVFLQIADSLALLHHGYDRQRRDPREIPRNWEPIVHADVKPSSIFCRQEYIPGGMLPSLALGNFGIAFLGRSAHFRGAGPTLAPPEYPLISAKADVWALGATIHALAIGKTPIVFMSASKREESGEHPSGRERAKASHVWISETKSQEVVQLKGRYSRGLDHCMMKCLELETEDRFDSIQLVDRVAMEKQKWEESVKLEKPDKEKGKKEKPQNGKERERPERKKAGSKR